MEKKKVLSLGILFLLIFILILFNLSNIENLDKLINKNIETIHSVNLTNIMIIISFIADSKTLIFFSLIILIFLFYKKKYNNALFYLFTILFGAIVEFLIKILIHRKRPENILIDESSFSFPSGHSVMSVIFFFLLIYLFINKIKSKTKKSIFIAISIILILFTGFSRIYLNAHWFSDVLGGFSLGLFIVLLSIFFFKLIKKVSY